jgi:hypothetical protein
MYAVLMVMLNMAFMHDAVHVTSTGKFGENSWTEILQELFLLILGVVFIVISRYDRSIAVISNLIAVFFFIAFIRELNNRIDYWLTLELPLFLLFAWLFYRDRGKIIPSLHRFLETPASAWFLIGFLVTFVFSRLFGRTGLWKAILGDDYNRWAKNAAEEGIELLGYSLFFIAGIEILWYVLKNKKQQEK